MSKSCGGIKMNILIVNDDGIASKGIEILTRALLPHGKIYISAPKEEQSGKGQSITITNGLEVEVLPLIPGVSGRIAVLGTPADAARAGIRIFDVEFDLVVSGINNGLNIAHDVLYSGTVGAASEAKLFGINAVAVSALNLDLPYLFDETFNLFNEIIERKFYDFDGILNINFPAIQFEKPVGRMFTKQGRRHYYSDLKKKSDDENFYYLVGTISKFEEDIDSDVWAYNNGFISITPLSLKRTNFDALNLLKRRK